MRCIPSAYLGKSLERAASTGALSTGMIFAQHEGLRSARAMTVFAPIKYLISVTSFKLCFSRTHRVSDQCRILQAVFFEECLDIVGECGIGVCLVMRRVTVIACIEGIYGTAESARKCTANIGLISIPRNDRSLTVLANTSIVFPVSEEAMDDHDRVALCVSLVIV